MGDSGSINYTQDSGSYWLARNDDYLFGAIESTKGRLWWHKPDDQNLNTARLRAALIYNDVGNTKGPRGGMTTGGGGPGTTCSGSYTFYQRVYDNINTFWCYYSGSTVNESPGMTDTTPHNSGDISGYSIVYTTEQIVCS
tara:strand:- start:206 stop:625 length:420 start_codon:yes stop_codon:yes gene_type:complete